MISKVTRPPDIYGPGVAAFIVFIKAKSKLQFSAVRVPVQVLRQPFASLIVIV